MERLIRAGALDSLGRPRRELLWQLREVAGASKGRVDGRTVRGAGGRSRAAGRPMDLRLPATEAPPLPADHRAGAAGRRLRGGGPRRAAPGGVAVPGGARPAGGGDQRGARRAAAGPGAHRRARRHPPAPDDRARDGVPGARGRDRDGQRHALAGHVAAAPVGRSGGTRCCSSTATSSARANVVNVIARVGHAARRGGADASAGPRHRPACARSGTPACGGWARPGRSRSRASRARVAAALRRRLRPARWPRFGLARLRNRLYQADAEANNAAPIGATIQALATYGWGRVRADEQATRGAEQDHAVAGGRDACRRSGRPASSRAARVKPTRNAPAAGGGATNRLTARYEMFETVPIGLPAAGSAA